MRLSALALSLLLALSARGDCVYPVWSDGAVLDRAADRVRAVDVNGDGHPDIVGHTAETIFVALNDGTAAFPESADVYSGAIAGPFFTLDFNGDADVDLLFGRNGAVVVLPGRGDGTFGTEIVTPIAVTPTDMLAVTVDPGPSLDLLVFDAILYLLVRYTNDGSGQFAEASRTGIGWKPGAFTAADFDGDGRTDAIVARPNESWTGPSPYDAFFAAQDGTFGSPTHLNGPFFIDTMQAADVAGNELPDLIVEKHGSFYVLPNLGARTLGQPTWTSTTSRLSGLEFADVNGDGKRDVTYSEPRCGFITLTGAGDGTFPRGSYWFSGFGANCTSFTAADLAVADFDGDTRPDVLVAAKAGSANFLRLFRSRCGDIDVSASIRTPIVTAGSDVEVFVEMRSPWWFSPDIPESGTVSIVEDGQTLATGMSTNRGDATITVSGLPLGVHELVAVYGGNEHYEPNQSAPVTVTVTSETTTTAISVQPSETEYGHPPPQIRATVTASNGQTPSGAIRIAIDGKGALYNAPTAQVPSSFLPASLGTHTITASYLGSEVHPPSSSTSSYTIVKQTPALDAAAVTVMARRPGTVTVSLLWTGDGFKPSGRIAIASDVMTFDRKTLDANAGPVTLTIPALPPGTHTLQVQYFGDSHYAAVTAPVSYTVLPLPAGTVEARGTANAITVIWNTNKTTVARSAAGGTWTRVCCPGQPFHDLSAEPATVYLYRMESADGSATQTDVAMRISFTNAPLLPQIPIRAVHLTEIVAAANAVRAAAGLAPLSAVFAAGDPVTAASLLAIRAGINEAREALGAYAYPFSGTIAPGLPVRASDIQELREAVR